MICGATGGRRRNSRLRPPSPSGAEPCTATAICGGELGTQQRRRQPPSQLPTQASINGSDQLRDLSPFEPFDLFELVELVEPPQILRTFRPQ